MRIILRATGIALLTLALLGPDLSQAQAPRGDSAPRAPWAVFAGGGLSNPSGPDAFKENWNVGTNLNGGVAFRLNRRLMLRPSLSVFSFGVDGDAIEDASPTGDYNLWTGTLDLLVELRYNPFPVWPYFVVGAGAFNGEKDVQGVPAGNDLGITSDGDTRFGLNGGGGVKTYFTDHVGVFAEAKFVVGFTGEFGVLFGTGYGGLLVQF